jgi:Major Facilitator Superfamily
LRLLFCRPHRGTHGTSRAIRPSLRDPRFALLVAGETVNSIGGWASAIVLWGFAAYRFNASPYAISVTVVCWAAPPAILSTPMGVYVDRLGAKNALVTGYLAAAAAALGMAAAGSLAVLDIAAAGYGIARSLAGPAAYALPPRIVAADDLLAANALLGSAGSAGQVVGPLAASAALALSGFPAGFILDAASYLIGVAVVAPLPLHNRDDPVRGRDHRSSPRRGDARRPRDPRRRPRPGGGSRRGRNSQPGIRHRSPGRAAVGRSRYLTPSRSVRGTGSSRGSVPRLRPRAQARPAPPRWPGADGSSPRPAGLPSPRRSAPRAGPGRT